MASTPAAASSSGSGTVSISSTAVATDSASLTAATTSTTSKRLDESLWWESFVVLLEELDSAPTLSDLDENMVNKFKRNHAWFLDSVSRFKPPNELSRRALDSNEISLGLHSLVIEPKLKEAALRASKVLCLDEVQTYILVSRSVEHDRSIARVEGKDFLQWVLLQYFFERQCLLKCIRLSVSSMSQSSGAIKGQALQLIHDRLEIKMLSVLKDLLSSGPFEKFLQDVELVGLWVDETIIEDNLILDFLFLAYYDNFCVCNAVQWMSLCSLFKDILGGAYNIENLAVSVESRASFSHAKAQLLLILIETLDLENLLRMVHDEVSISEGGFIFSMQDVQEMDFLVSTFSGFGTFEAGPLFLAWAVFICLLSSLPDIKNESILVEIDHADYARQAFEVGTCNYLLEVLRSDCLRDSDGPVSGFLNILRTFVSAFIASYELNHQESLSIQFWDRDSFVDGPIRSLLYMLESEYPYHIIELLHLLSALCNGSWSAECVYNFLEKMNGMASLFESPCGSPLMDVYDLVYAHQRIPVPGVEGLFISPGTCGQILKVIDVNIALVRWECAHSGVYLLVLRLAQMSHSNGHDEVNLILNLLHRLVSSNAALCFNLMHLDESLYTKAARNNGLIEQNLIDVVRVISSLTVHFIEDGGHASNIAVCLNILAQIAPSHVIDMVLSSNIVGTTYVVSPSDAWLLSGGLSEMLLVGHAEESGCFLLTTSVLDLTVQLIEKGTGDTVVCALAVFSLRYFFVSQMHMMYKLKYGQWKVLDVVRSCVKGARGCHKLGSMIRDILNLDSSILNSLCQLLYVSEQAMEKSSRTHWYGLKETEDLQEVACSALDIFYYLLADLLKGNFLASPPFVQVLLPSSNKTVSVFSATLSLMSLFSNPAVQVAATKVLSMLCVIASRLQPYSLENITLADAVQIGDLTATICRILDEEPCKRKDFLISILDFLVSAACFQPSLLVSIISSHVAEESLGVNAGHVNNKLDQALLVNQINSGRRSAIDSVLKYVNRSELLINSDPRILMSTLNFLKSLWDGGVPYMDTLDKVRKSARFWEHLSSVLAKRLNFDYPLKDLSVDDIQHATYRYRCQGIVLEIMARELFLQEKEYKNEIYGTHDSNNSSKGLAKNRLIFEASQSLIKLLQNDILSNWNEGSIIYNLMNSYSSGGYDTRIVSRAKMAACILIVHLMLTLSDGSAECLSVPLIGRIHLIQDKLRQNPSFSALLEQYSDGKKVSSLVLHDLYYHLQGELEGRLIAPGHFLELSAFLLNFENFQCKESTNEKDLWSTDVMMYDISNIRAELGIDLWDKSEWKTAKEIGERMLSYMHASNLMLSLAGTKNFALKALISIMSLHHEKVLKSKSTITSHGISDAFIERSIIHICRCIQSTEDSLVPLLNPSEKLLELFTTQAEMLLVLSRILFMQHSLRNNKKQLFSVSIILIRTSGSCFKSLAMDMLSTKLNKAVKFFLMVLLMSMEFNNPGESINDDSGLDNNQLAETSLAIVGLLPVLCKYVERIECFDLSVASMDLMLRSFLMPDIWLPILQENLPLKHLIQITRQRFSLSSVTIALNFLLTLAQTKGGAEMLHSVNLFPSLKVLFKHLVDETKPNPDVGCFSANYGKNNMHAHLLCFTFAIISSVCHSLRDDSSFIDIFGSAIHNFFADKANMISLCFTTPNFPSDVQSYKIIRKQDPQTSLASLRLSEHALLLICLLARHRNYRRKGMKEIDFEVRQKSIHFLAFISKEIQHVEDLSNSMIPLFCLPTLKEEHELNEKPSFIGSKHGWFVVSALAVSSKNKATSSLSTGLPLVTKDYVNGCAQAMPTYFSDVVAIQIYRITFLLLTYLCMQAKAAAERAEEVGYIDLARFPDLPMPEILHGLQDQAIAVVVDVCEAKCSAMPVETEGVCLLMLQILEKSLYLEFCVTQSCGIRPVLGRIEDVSKEIKSLIQVVKQHKNLKPSLASLRQILTLVYPGLMQTSSLL
ncbi:hypothetical protein IEQ34_018684 [Dendrobium chrysotoxum]|uniref:Uncharacterized protein n=1 Tax=Dendrobium chrysotoxum TaxID=161865 RepID=A0AAV7G6F8_DENCH|nr:hypothetical protein IEQ34_018684 [Dendrobium chrysotoxum]